MRAASTFRTQQYDALTLQSVESQGSVAALGLWKPSIATKQSECRVGAQFGCCVATVYIPLYLGCKGSRTGTWCAMISNFLASSVG
jgi:hypothetical protein